MVIRINAAYYRGNGKKCAENRVFTMLLIASNRKRKWLTPARRLLNVSSLFLSHAVCLLAMSPAPVGPPVASRDSEGSRRFVPRH